MSSSPTLAYLVLRCADLERSRGFYEALGFTVVPEQHGAGPKHYACKAGDVVVELYALGAERSTGARIGLWVEDAGALVSAVGSIGGEIVRVDAAGALVRDPDGHTIHLMERSIVAHLEPARG